MSSQQKKIVVFLGAGASVPVGIPDSKKLARIVGKKLPQYSKRIRLIKRNIQDFGFSYDIESLLSVLEFWANPRKAIDETGAFFAEIANRGSLKSFRMHKKDQDIAKKVRGVIVEECFVNDPSKVHAIKLLYEKFFKDLHDVFQLPDCNPAGNKACPPADVFTTNYDNVVEEYCAENGMPPPCDGYRELPIARRGTFEFDEKCYTDPDSIIRLRLYKLHGTVTYVRLPHGELRLMPLFPGRKIQISGKTFPGGELRISGKPALFDLIYPGTYQYATREPQLELLNLLKQNLASSSCCIVIGYSFRDPNIRQIFRDVLLKSKRLRRQGKVVLVSPEAKKVIANQKLAGLGIKAVKKKFEDLSVVEDIGGRCS